MDYATSFAASEAAVAASEGHMNNADDDHSEDASDNNIASSRTAAVEAMISFLCTEANVAEERAERLRNEGKALAEQFGLDFNRYNKYKHHGPNSNEMAPLDEYGNPKYKGKKRGRKPKPRKRKHNPDREKRKHTGYTLFVHETHPLIKTENIGATNTQIVSIVAKRWRELPDSERDQWKERALATHEEETTHGDQEEEGYPNVKTVGGGDDSSLPPARKRTKRK
ncbi:HMG high mobility group box-containing protein [Nitzschia inconspicua]|uniref:HMG high mobility group box-containing protein n=1 Tax=Nitzschia inconspicua TaxID=303405 RepID=A0A9K3KR50_9STRA|nr:HMG high mobility group box-containing protein [Nitzschia inconspicua]